MDGNNHYLHTGDALFHENTEGIGIEHLQRLVRLLDTSEVSELEVKRSIGKIRLVLRKAREAEVSELGELLEATRDETAPETSTHDEAKQTIVAPLVGIFHLWAKPQGKALVAIGDRIKVGQRVGTIQSLNVMNDVEAVVAGRITEVLVQDGQPVEYGQPLMIVESAEEG
jgi:acetyl-CoA carboxylase biotin carboxyl carrier protein